MGFSFAALAALNLGCGGESFVDVDENAEDTSSQAIINGTLAPGYPEAALVDMGVYACSGSPIAPRGALTAGH